MYEESPLPGMVLLDGEPVPAHEECNRLADIIRDLEGVLAPEPPAPRDRDTERLLDRYLYAPDERTERGALRELVSAFFPGAQHMRRF